MSLDTVKKIVSNSSIEMKRVNSVGLCNWGEPLLNSEILEIIKYLKDTGAKKINFVTNGVLLDKEIFSELRKAGLDSIAISCDIKHGSKRSIEYEKWKGKIIEILTENKDFPVKINTTIVEGESKEEYNELVDTFKPYVSEFHAHPAITFEKHGIKPGKICKFLKNKDLLILSDGRITPCCVDYNGEMCLGNATEMDLRDALEKKKHFADLWNEGHFSDICQRCDEEDTFSIKRFDNF